MYARWGRGARAPRLVGRAPRALLVLVLVLLVLVLLVLVLLTHCHRR